MKLVDLTCPSCGGKMQVNPELSTVTCNYCGNQLMVDKEIVEQKITGGFDFGYEQEQGKQKALEEAENEKRIIKNLCDAQKIIRFFSTYGFLLSFGIFVSIIYSIISGSKPSLSEVLLVILLAMDACKNMITILFFENSKIHIPAIIANIILFLFCVILLVFVNFSVFKAITASMLLDIHGIISTIWLDSARRILKNNSQVNLKEVSIKHFGNTKKTSITVCVIMLVFISIIISAFSN